MNYHSPNIPKGHSRTECPIGAERESVLLLPTRHAYECVVVLRCYGGRSPMC
jgi:hypothetical protein